MFNCKEQIECIERDNSKSNNPFSKLGEKSCINDSCITLLENKHHYIMIVEGTWNFSTNWFPFKTSFRPLQDGIYFSVRKDVP